MDRSAFVQWAAAAVLLVGLLLLWIEAGFRGETTTLAVVDVANLVAALLAGVACLARGARETGRPGRGWRLLGLGCLAWALGVAYITYYDLVSAAGVPFAQRDIPFPSIADVGYLVFVPLALAGMLLIPTGVFTAGLRLRNVLDGGIVAVSLLAATWILVLRELWRTDLGTPVEAVILLAYPWGDFLLAATAVLAWEFMPRERRDEIVLLVVGLGLLAFADIGFFVLVLREHVGISAINALWPAGFAALALSAVRPPVQTEPDPLREPSHGLVPLAATGGILALALATVAHGIEPGTAVLSTLLAGLLVARLGLSRSERRRVAATARRHPGES